jgi:Saxitoxin biosynthesis operon protein SxtJ
VPDCVTRVWEHILALSTFKKSLLGFAFSVFLIEVVFRRVAPGSQAYAAWTRFFQGIGKVWTAVILSLVYVLSVGPIGVFMKIFGRDPLDRSLAAEPSFWREHEPNPLGAEASVRHQF